MRSPQKRSEEPRPLPSERKRYRAIRAERLSLEDPAFVRQVIFTVHSALCKFPARLHVVQDKAHSLIGRASFLLWQ